MSRDFLDQLRDELADRYALEGRLGEGGMATVYRAWDLKHQRLVAIKVLRPEVAEGYGARRFLSEIKVTAKLQHPNVLPLFDSGEIDGLPYYVMPFVEGESLREHLAREAPLPTHEAIRIARGVASALDHAHRRGIVHRDVKPGNILLADGEALVSDFGIALVPALLGEERITEVGLAPGTLAYMSPEQAVGDPVDFRSDIYSLGCVTFEMLAGKPPFSGTNAQILRYRHATAETPSLRAIRAELGEKLDDAVQVALSKDPAQRFDSAGAFVAALEAGDKRSSVVRRGLGRGIATVGAILAIAVVAWFATTGSAQDLDPNRVVIYPLVSSGRTNGDVPLGEEVATMIGAALDGTGPLRWIDGWTLLDPERRNDIRTLSLGEAERIARGRNSAYFVTGRVVDRSDSVEVFLDLYDTRDGEVVARAQETGAPGQPWDTGLLAVNTFLPRLIPGGATDVSSEWRSRHPTAIANFLLGEAAFRRVNLEAALRFYQSAVDVDSSFAIAAIRGAQAASWNHAPSEAATFIEVASRHPLPSHYRAFVNGYGHYLSGAADSAAISFRAVTELAPEMAVAWAQLGEVYTHLLPLAGNADSIADLAFLEARTLDVSAASFLLHPIEIRLRRGDLAGAAPLLDRFAGATPPDDELRKLRIMEECVRDGADRVRWLELADDTPVPLLMAANAMGRADCQEAAFRAILQVDTASGERDPQRLADGRRWLALIGAFSTTLPREGAEAAARLVEAFQARWGYGSTVFLLAAPVDPELAERAREAAAEQRVLLGEGYLECHEWWCPRMLWELGVFEILFGRPGVAQGIARELAGFRQASGSPDSEGLARALEAQLTLAEGDTARAIDQLSALVPQSRTGGPLMWDPAEPHGWERLLLARLLLARNRPSEAFAVAEMFDSARPLAYLLYLPASLEVRIEAARASGDGALAERLEARLDRIREGS